MGEAADERSAGRSAGGDDTPRVAATLGARPPDGASRVDSPLARRNRRRKSFLALEIAAKKEAAGWPSSEEQRFLTRPLSLSLFTSVRPRRVASGLLA